MLISVTNKKLILNTSGYDYPYITRHYVFRENPNHPSLKIIYWVNIYHVLRVTE